MEAGGRKSPTCVFQIAGKGKQLAILAQHLDKTISAFDMEIGVKKTKFKI